MSSLPFVPFISYRTAETDDTYSSEDSRNYESRTRHWAMVWWQDGDVKRTAEFCVITEAMPDFCGGLMVYSPRVDDYSSDCAWSSSFCSMGQPGPNETVPIKWSEFDEKTMALDLVACTGKENWTKEEVHIYGMQCIAAQVAAEMLAAGRRGVMGADFVGGKMTALWRTMAEMGEFQATRTAQHVTIGGSIGECLRTPTGFQWKVAFDAREDTEWRNVNSGNRVHWLCANIIGTGEHTEGDGTCYNCGHEYDMMYHEYCPECDEYNDYDPHDCEDLRDGRYELPKAISTVYEGGEYRRRARRYYWRNG